MKIVVVSSLAFSLINFRGRLLASMVANGHEVIACAPDRDAAVEARLAALGVRFRHMPMARTGMNPFRDVQTFSWLLVMLWRERPDIVLAYTQKPIIYGGLATRCVGRTRFYAMVSGLGHVFSDDMSGRLRHVRRLVSFLYRRALAHAQAVFVFNRDDRHEMLAHGIIDEGAQVIQVPGSGVDLDHYACQPLPEVELSFLMIARLLRNKGLDDYAEAARLVRAERPDIRFRLLGPFDSNLAAISRETIAQWNRDGLLEYCGETQDVRPHLAQASVFVLPSWYREGLPRTLLEAMAIGRGVITTDMPGCREPVVEGENGFLVPPRNPQALANAMLRIAADPGLVVAMGAAARRTVEEYFSVEKVNAMLLDTMGLVAHPTGVPVQPDRSAPPVRAFATGGG